MKHISVAAKEALVKKVLNRGTQSIAAIATANNVGYSSLQKWIKQFRSSGLSSSANRGTITPEERFHHLLKTADLDEVALGVYCREQGIYSHQLTQWKTEMTADKTSKNDQQQQELKTLRAENKMLKKDLHRKEKALAETAALLVLKKKADLIWGVSEDD